MRSDLLFPSLSCILLLLLNEMIHKTPASLTKKKFYCIKALFEKKCGKSLPLLSMVVFFLHN